MKTLTQYLREEKDEKDDKSKEDKAAQRGAIKFTIWKAPDEKVKWLEDDEQFLKIEYKHEDRDKHMYIDFLLGTQEGVWKLWIGKIGACSYDDDPYCSFDTTSFAEGIVAALDKVEEFIAKVEEDPYDYTQFYRPI